jgi:hypothetical protein
LELTEVDIVFSVNARKSKVVILLRLFSPFFKARIQQKAKTFEA